MADVKRELDKDSDYIKGLQFALNICRPLWSMSPDAGRKLIGVIVASIEAEIKRARRGERG